MTKSRSDVRRIVIAGVVDVVLVLAFAAIGRASHTESVEAIGVIATAWPFLTGLAVGWLITRAWRAPFAVVRTGLGVWAVCVAGGLVLRAVSGQGIPLGFVIVTTVVLAIFLLGWRAATNLRLRPTRG